MAYKFQLGAAKLSGSILVEEGVESLLQTDISSSNDLLAANDLDVGGNGDIAGTLAVGDVATFGNQVTVSTGDMIVSSGVYQGQLQHSMSAGAGIDMLDFDNQNSRTIAVDETWLSGTIRGYLSVSNSDEDALSTLNYADGVFTFNGLGADEIRQQMSASGWQISYDQSSGVISMATPDTDDVAEGSTNLYFTEERVDDRVAALIVGGDAITASYDDAAGSLTLAAQVDDSSIEIVSDALQVKALGITNAMLSGAIANDKLENNTISGVALGSTLYALTDGNGIADFSYDGSSAVSIAIELASSNALTASANGLDLLSTITGDRTFSGNVTVSGDLIVTGSLTYVNTTNLAISDALITIGSGSSAFATGYGIEFGAMGDSWASLETAEYDYDQDGSADNVLSSSLPIRAENISADSFWGNLIGNVAANVYNRAGDATMAVGVNWYDQESSSRVATLPTGSNLVEGDMVKIKAGNLTGAGAIVITAAGSDTIDGPHGSITLESAYAAVSLVYVGGGEWRVF